MYIAYTRHLSEKKFGNKQNEVIDDIGETRVIVEMEVAWLLAEQVYKSSREGLHVQTIHSKDTVIIHNSIVMLPSWLAADVTNQTSLWCSVVLFVRSYCNSLHLTGTKFNATRAQEWKWNFLWSDNIYIYSLYMSCKKVPPEVLHSFICMISNLNSLCSESSPGDKCHCQVYEEWRALYFYTCTAACLAGHHASSEARGRWTIA